MGDTGRPCDVCATFPPATKGGDEGDGGGVGAAGSSSALVVQGAEAARGGRGCAGACIRAASAAGGAGAGSGLRGAVALEVGAMGCACARPATWWTACADTEMIDDAL